MAFSGAGSWCIVVLAAVCAALSGIPAFGTAHGVRAECSPGYYQDASDDGACVLCTGHSVGIVQRGAPILADEIALIDPLAIPRSVALSGSGAVLALGFPDVTVNGEILVGVVRVYSWSGVAWEQRGGDIENGASSGFFGTVLALSEDGNVVASSAEFVIALDAGAVYVFVWDGASWSLRGDAFFGTMGLTEFGISIGLSASGCELVIADVLPLNGELASVTFVYVWAADTSEWVLRGAPLAGPTVIPARGARVAVSGDGDVVVVASLAINSGFGEGSICVYEWVSGNSQYEKVGNPFVDGASDSDGLGGNQSVALSRDGLVLAAGVGGRGANGPLSGGVQVFGRDGEEWVPMGSLIEGAAAGDLAGSSVAISDNGQVLLVPSRGSDSSRGSLAVYVWSSRDWEQRGDVLAGPFAGFQFATYVAVSGDGTVVASGANIGSGLRVYNLTAELGNVDDAACQAAYNDTAAYVVSEGVCSGEGSMDVCVVCTGGEYPIGPARACGVCPAGEYRHATSFACDPCPADSGECQAVFGSSRRTLDINATCSGLESGCVLRPLQPFGAGPGDSGQCTAGYYRSAGDGDACVLCTGHSVGTVQRGAPVPFDETADETMNPYTVALSGTGSVLAIGFYDVTVGGVELVGVVRVYSWSGVAWVQRGDDIDGAAAEGEFGFVVALSDDGNVVAASAASADTVAEEAGAVSVFIWDGTSWSQIGSTIVGIQPFGLLGSTMGLGALGSEFVIGEFYEGLDGNDVIRAFVYVWDVGGRDWALRGAPLVGSAASEMHGISVAISGDGDVVAIGTRGPSVGLVEGIICVYEWVPDNSRYERVGDSLVGVLGEFFGGTESLALSGDGLVLAAGVRGRSTNGQQSGGVRVFGREGQQWVPMGSIIEGAASGDNAGSSVALSEDGHVLVVPSRGSDTNRGSVLLYVWSPGDWAQRGGAIAGLFPTRRFGMSVALSRDGTVVAAASGFASGVRVFDLTAERGSVDDAACQAAYSDTAAYVVSEGVCSGEGSMDVCVVCTGGAYPIGPARACGVCPAGEYRHATSFACDPCPADSAECQAVFGSSGWSLDTSVTCSGLESGCVGPL